MKTLILLFTLTFSNFIYAQAMNSKAYNLYERAINIQKKCVKRIIRFNRLIKSGKLTYNQKVKIKQFKNNRIKIYKKIKFSNKYGKSLK